MNDTIIANVIAEVLNDGDRDNQQWFFYENTDGLHDWTLVNALEERARFINTVIKRYYEEVAK